MTDIVKVCAIIAVTALLSLILKDQKNGIGHLISVTGTVIAGLFAVRSLSPILEYTNNLESFTPEIIGLLIRVVGISYIADLASSVCRDMNETSLAMGVELCGKAEILIISFPMLKRLIELCVKLMV